MTPDQINGCFEVVAGLLLTLNVIRLHRDKQVRGVHIVPIAFMAIWGFWNLYFYSYINAPWSWMGGIIVVAVNSVWVGQMVYYRKRKNIMRISVPERKSWPDWDRKYTTFSKEELKEKIRKAYDRMIFQPPRNND